MSDFSNSKLSEEYLSLVDQHGPASAEVAAFEEKHKDDPELREFFTVVHDLETSGKTARRNRSVARLLVGTAALVVVGFVLFGIERGFRSSLVSRDLAQLEREHQTVMDANRGLTKQLGGSQQHAKDLQAQLRAAQSSKSTFTVAGVFKAGTTDKITLETTVGKERAVFTVTLTPKATIEYPKDAPGLADTNGNLDAYRGRPVTIEISRGRMFVVIGQNNTE